MADFEKKKKSPRKRMKGIYDRIIQQMEFYFSDANLSRDRFMKQKIDDTSDGYLELSLFMNFNKLKKISADIAVISKALSFSNSLQLNEEKTKVKRKKPYTPPKDTDERTVYVECLPHKTNHEWISTLFSSCGKVTYVSLPKYRSTGDRKGFAFVEFEDVESARKACEELNNPPVEAANKPGKFPKSNKQLLYYRDRVAGQNQEMESENQKNDEKTEEVAESKPTESPGKSKKARKRRRMTSESSADGGSVGGRKSSTHSEEKESDSSISESSPKKRKKQQGRESLDGSKEARGEIKSKKQSETLRNEEDTSGKRRMSQSRKSLEEGKKTGKKSDKKEKGAEEDVKHSDLSDSSTQDVTKESKKRKHSDGQSVEGEVPIKQQKRESGKEGGSEKDEKKGKKKRDRRKKKKSHKDKTLPELRVLPKKEWLKLREEYLSLQKKSMSELKESLKHIKENQPTDTGDNDAEKVTKPEVTTELVETPDVIIRVQCASDMNRKEIKEDLGTEVNVAYIDVKEGARDGYIRFKDAASAKKISESSIKSYLFNLLKGDDERAYWQKLKSDREAKHNTKSSRKKVKGTQKLIDRTEKINKENVSRVHIKFDDDDE